MGSIDWSHVANVRPLSAKIVLQKGNHKKGVEGVKEGKSKYLKNSGVLIGAERLMVFSIIQFQGQYWINHI